MKEVKPTQTTDPKQAAPLLTNISKSYNRSSKNTKKSLRQDMRTSLTKSLIEDASEDFTNIEEHMSGFQAFHNNHTRESNINDASNQ